MREKTTTTKEYETGKKNIKRTNKRTNGKNKKKQSSREIIEKGNKGSIELLQN